MSLRSTLGLFVVFVALCAGYWGMIHFEARTVVKDIEARKLYAFDPAEIVSLEITRADETPVMAQREKGKPWAITKPLATIDPNQVVWDRLAASFAELVEERLLEPTNEKAAQYGLDKPILTIKTQTSDGKAYSCTFGAADPTQTGRYAMGQDGKIFLIIAKAFQDMDQPLDMLRNPYVLNAGDKTINKIEFARFWTEQQAQKAKEQNRDMGNLNVGDESLVVTLEKDANGAWQIKTPFEATANQQLVNTVIQYMQFATGHNYIDAPQDMKSYGLAPPKARVTVYPEGGTPQTLLLGDQEPAPKEAKGKDDKRGYFAKNGDKPSVFLLDGIVAEFFPRTPDVFRENRLMTRSASELNRIHYKALETDITLEFDPEKGWAMAGLTPGETDQVAVSNFITLLTSMKGKGFPDGSQPQSGLDNPAIKIELGFKNNTAPAEIKVAAQMPETKQYYAMQDNGIVILLSDLDVATLTKTALDFRNKNLFQFPKTATSRIVLDMEGTQYIFNKVHSEWRIMLPENKTLINPEAITALAGALSEMRAAAIETLAEKTDLAPYGLNTPMATLSINYLPEGATTETTLGPLKIGVPDTKNPQLRYASIASKPGVYCISQSIVDQIRDTLKCVK